MKIKDGFKGSRAYVLPRDIIRELEQDEFAKDLHITDIGYYPQAKHHYRKRLVGINQYVLLYCISGSGWCEFEGKHIELHAHQFIVLPKNVPHTYASDDESPWSIYWIHFAGEKAHYFAKGLSVVTEMTPSENSRIEQRIDLFEEMLTVLESSYGMHGIYYSCTCLYYFLGSLLYLNYYRELTKKKSYDLNVVERSIHFMNENIERKLTLKELAENTSYSTSHFSTIFRAKTGCSPLNYFMNLKIQKSCSLLQFTDMKVNQIAYKLGFVDPFYFCRVFKRTMGVSPSDFRKS